MMMTESNVAVEEFGDVVVVRPLDTKVTKPDGVDSLVGVLRDVVENREGAKLVLDLSEVRFLCSAALNQLIVLDRRLKTSGGSWRVCSLRREISEILAITHLDSLFPVVASQEEAMASLEA